MRCPPRSDRDRGAVTVEAAIAVGAIVLVAAMVVGAVAAVLASVRCVDAARELARAASRGDTERGRAVAARIAPSGAELDVRTDGETVVAVVRAAPIATLPVEVSGSASGLLEPGVVQDSTPPIPDSAPPDADGLALDPTTGTAGSSSAGDDPGPPVTGDPTADPPTAPRAPSPGGSVPGANP